MANATYRIGSKTTIKAGTRVTTQGRTTTRKTDSIVTVRAVESARNGKTRITWKSNGYLAYANM